jgi:hypothetical protein
MTSFLFERKIRIFDYPKFAEPCRNRIRENAEKIAAEAESKSSSSANGTSGRKTG